MNMICWAGYKCKVRQNTIRTRLTCLEVGNDALGFPVTITSRLDIFHLALAAVDLAWTRIALRFLIRQTPPFCRFRQRTLGGRAQNFFLYGHLVGHRIALA